MSRLQKRQMQTLWHMAILASGRGDELDDRITPMKAETSKRKTTAAEALELLEQAWSYYMPEPKQPQAKREPDLFEYANAA